jgi:hypothetical protein
MQSRHQRQPFGDDDEDLLFLIERAQRRENGPLPLPNPVLRH